MGDLTFVAPHTHNLFLQVGVDLGVMGLVGYLALLLTSYLTRGQFGGAGRPGWREPQRARFCLACLPLFWKAHWTLARGARKADLWLSG